MSFRQPFRAVPIKPGSKYQRGPAGKQRNEIAAYLGGAALFGIVVGTVSALGAPGGMDALLSAGRPLAVSAGLMRARAPQEGDNWSGCNAARAAGTAPIYAGEPGFRSDMDGDSDGIACEPYHAG